MTGRRAIVGLCMLCALLVSAFAAQSASAVTNGTTAFTCVNNESTGTLAGPHCLPEGTKGAVGKYEHVAITEVTAITGTNANSAGETKEASTGRLKVTIAGVPLELGATTVSGSGTMENALNGSEHVTKGAGTITFTGVAVTKPEGRGCKVFTDNEDKTKGEQGVVHTRPLVATTQGQNDSLKFEPADGPTKSFANFFVECEAGKQIPAIEGTWECIGTVNGVPTGATTHFDHVETTAQNTLKCKGTKSGIEGDLTISGKKVGGEEAPKPLAAKTVGT